MVDTPDEESRRQLPRVSGWWVGLYCFAALWMLVLITQDASHFGPGFFPLLISLALVPLLTMVFLVDLIVRVFDAIDGKDSSTPRRILPVVVATGFLALYGTISILFLTQAG